MEIVRGLKIQVQLTRHRSNTFPVTQTLPYVFLGYLRPFIQTIQTECSRAPRGSLVRNAAPRSLGDCDASIGVTFPFPPSRRGPSRWAAYSSPAYLARRSAPGPVNYRRGDQSQRDLDLPPARRPSGSIRRRKMAPISREKEAGSRFCTPFTPWSTACWGLRARWTNQRLPFYHVI